MPGVSRSRIEDHACYESGQSEQTLLSTPLARLIRDGEDATIITASDGAILQMTTAAEQMLGCSSADAIGRHVACFIPSAFVNTCRRTFSEAVRADGRRFLVDISVSLMVCGSDDAYKVTLVDLDRQQRPTERALRRNADAGRARALVTHNSGARVATFDPSRRRRVRAARATPGQLDELEQQARRIALALHDEVGQLLTSAHLALDQARAKLPPAASDQLDDVKRSLDSVEDELRRVAHELRPRILDDIGLVAAIEFLAEGIEKRRRVAVTVDAHIRRRLSQLVETSVYRLVQEALNNASKHAHASRIAIGLANTHRLLRCTVHDDGIGFDPLKPAFDGGLGLSGMRDRIDMLGGTLEIDSTPGGGTRLTIIIPLER